MFLKSEFTPGLGFNFNLAHTKEIQEALVYTVAEPGGV